MIFCVIIGIFAVKKRDVYGKPIFYEYLLFLLVGIFVAMI